MGVVTSDVLKLLTAGLRTDFDVAYRQRRDASVVNVVATRVPTTMPTQDYGWLGASPTMREFVDERVSKGLKQYEYSISDKTWEATLEVERKAIEDDQYGIIRLRAQDLANEPTRHQEQASVELLAQNLTGPDGQNFVDTDHAESGTNQSNKSTSALDETQLSAAISAMQVFTDDLGKVMGITPTHLLVGPKLQWTARKLLESTTNVVTKSITADASGAMIGDRNVLQGALQLLVSPYLRGTYDDYWFVLDCSRAIRAVILQERSDVPVELAALDDPNSSESVFMRDKFYYGVRARYNVGYGLWQCVFGGIL